MTSRRKFITQASLASAGLLFSAGFRRPSVQKVAGIQLYSLRDQLPANPRDVIQKVARAGYVEVETFGLNKTTGFWGLSPKQFGEVLKVNGLRTPSGHYDMNQFFGTRSRENLDIYIAAAHVLGQEYIIVPSLQEQFIRTESDFKKVADNMNAIAAILKKEGLKLGYHNHNFEWKAVDGTTFYDTLVKNTDPGLVYLEMDMYWVVRAGQDPAVLFGKYKNRFRLIHIKDMDKTNPAINTEVGKGSIDYKGLIPKAEAAGVRHFLMEQENFTNIDPYVSIKESADYIKKVLGS
ncbi:MAG TPA: sugar phosphate isomerase/epimerase [Puia sp.]|uniref:sugar phosphate isomerase/epimerase family protein n=1 Tax=Puia sp. TaxID=2045100 RepID=UPI002C883218|nr:sugar phosphate isomerase/epimerase [Puia sp.]HVU98712.1 sugar phosphate isomerase/epimerase [Puia sp.]